MKPMTARSRSAERISTWKFAQLTSVAAMALTLCAPTALAQQASDADSEVDEARKLNTVTVTARKQDESLQDVPVAVTAVSGEELSGFQLDKAQEFATRIPTLNIQAGGSGGGGSIGLRGIASSDISAAFDSAVAINVDGVVANASRLVQSSFMDLEQIEVLKGPQSLYFGKSASAGVISLKTRNPGDEFEWGASAAYEFEEQGTVLDGFVSGPLTDTLGARAAIRYFDAEEIIENTHPGAPNPSLGESSLDGRLTIAWEPVSNFSANFKYARSEYENDSSLLFEDAECAIPGQPAAGFYPQFIALVDPSLLALALTPASYDCDSTDQRFAYPDQDPIEAVQMPRNNGGVPYADLETDLARLQLDWDLSDTLSLTSVTGYLDIHSEEMASYSRTPEGGGIGTPLNSRETFSQELRLASDFDGPFNFQLGAYYEDRDIFFQTGQTVFGAASAIAILFPLTGGAAGPFGPFGPTGADIATGNTYDWEYFQGTEAEATSLFASFDYDLTNRWNVSGGLRWTDEEKTGQFIVPYSHAAFAGIAAPSGTESPVLSFEDENVSPELSVTYAATDNINIYGAYKTGFKSGGVDTSALPTVSTFAAIDACAPDFNPDTCEVIFDSETSEGFEIGVKSELLDNALRLNVVAYEYVYENLQVQQFIASQTLFRTFNAGEITTRGVEADMVWLTDIDGLTITGALAFLDNEFTDEFVSADGNNLRGQPTAGSPEWAGNIGFDYGAPLSGTNFRLGLGGNLSFSSEYFTEQEKAVGDRDEEDGYALLDLRASIGPENGPWTISLIANNVFDEIYTLGSGDRPFPPPGAESDVINRQNRGRQVFLKAAIAY